MRKVTSVLLVTGLAVLLSGCVLLQRFGIGGTPAGPAQETSGGPFSGTLQAAVALGVPMKCTYTVEGTEVEGWIKGKQYRGKIKDQQGQMGEMLMKDSCMWTWDETKGQGVKICFDPEENKDIWEPGTWEATETDGAQPPDVEYHCNPAVVTDALFQPPTNIEFTDLDQMMQGFKEGAMPNDEEMNEMQEKMEQMMDYGAED